MAAPRAWLMLAVTGDTHWGGNTGYEDIPAQFYSWDSKVSNAASVEPGDRVVLRDRDFLLGASVIEEIESTEGEKIWRRCPHCGSKKITHRTIASPPWRCGARACKEPFAAPSEGLEAVTLFRARHDAGWVDLHGVLTSAELRGLSLYAAGATHSIQPLDWNGFEGHLRERLPDFELETAPLHDRARHVVGGFGQPTPRAVRRGQSAFRKALFDRYGSVCAISGRAPDVALDAAHLYSYAELGEHHVDGGLLLRSDIHALLDSGLLAVNPVTLRVDVAPSIRVFDTYGRFHGQGLTISVDAAVGQWLTHHWNLYRGTAWS